MAMSPGRLSDDQCEKDWIWEREVETASVDEVQRLGGAAWDRQYRRLREAQPNARVILMTAYGYDPSHTIVKARQDGLRFVLFKPFRVDQLLTALESPDGVPPAPSAETKTEVVQA